MGFFGDTATRINRAHEGFKAEQVKTAYEDAYAAQLANRKRFVARLPLTEEASTAGDIRSWSAATERIEGAGWKLSHWAVTSENGVPVAYPVFERD